MGSYEYIVERIDGDYAYLRRTDIYDRGEPFMISVTLLPDGVTAGDRIHWENMKYTISPL